MKLLTIDNSDITLSFDFNDQNATLSFLVAFLSALVWTYSLKYISQNRLYYFSWLSVFIVSMLGFINSDNLFITFVCWEGLGLSSYFLVRFFQDNEAEKKAKLVFIFNRVADLGFLLMLAVCVKLGTFSIGKISSQLADQSKQLFIFGLIMCSFGKSAQTVFFPWLQAAMAGPTTVSSLLHSATMVGAGAILFYKFCELIPLNVLNMVFWAVGITYVIVAISAIASKDAKELLAYSTIANLSLLFMAVCVSPVNFVPMFISHAFFKCGSFLLVAYLSKKAGSTLFSELRRTEIDRLDIVLLTVLSLGLASVVPFGVGLFKPETNFAYLSSLLASAYGYKFFRELFRKPTKPVRLTLYNVVVSIIALASVVYPLSQLGVLKDSAQFAKSIATLIAGMVLVELAKKVKICLSPAGSIEFIILGVTTLSHKVFTSASRSIESALTVILSSFQDSIKLTGEIFNRFTYRSFKTMFASLLLVWLILIFLS